MHATSERNCNMSVHLPHVIFFPSLGETYEVGLITFPPHLEVLLLMRLIYTLSFSKIFSSFFFFFFFEAIIYFSNEKKKRKEIIATDP